MAAGSGSIIEAVDYNTIRNKVASVLGTGAGKLGYGQTLYSSAVATGNTITAEQWQKLEIDLRNIRWHQTGAIPNIPQVSQGAVVSYNISQPNTFYNTLAETAISDAANFPIGAGRSVIDSGISQTRTTPWENSLTTTATITFNSANDARYFFNSGGKLQISASRIGGSITQQNSSWSSVIASAGVLTIGATATSASNISFWNLTNIYTTENTKNFNATTPYSSNLFQVRAKCNLANNANGGAWVVDIQFNFLDAYVDPGNNPGDIPNTTGVVDGTLTVTVNELRASGPMIPPVPPTPGLNPVPAFPANTPFTILRPAYVITTLAGS